MSTNTQAISNLNNGNSDTNSKSKAPKLCHKCGNFKSYSNFNTHFKNCISKEDKKIDLINKQIEEIKNLKAKVMQLEHENFTLKNTIQNFENNQNDRISFDNLLILKKDNTRKLYKNVWNSYLAFCREFEKNHESINSAIEYFDTISKSNNSSKALKPSTRNTTRSVLIRLFKLLFNKDLSMLRKHKFRNLKLKPKYTMSNNEIKEFLTLHLNNLEVFLSFYILTFSSCRCHSLGMLKKEHYVNEEFHMFDSKTENYFQFKMSGRVLELVDEYLSMHTDTFLFFSQNLTVKEEDELVRIRGKYVSNKIINLIKKSCFFKKEISNTYCLSSHMWRRTQASISHKEAFEFACEASRKSIRQAANSTANLYYVPRIENYENKEYTKLKIEIDEIISDYLNQRSQRIFETNIEL